MREIRTGPGQIEHYRRERLQTDFGIDADWTHRVCDTAKAAHDLRDRLAVIEARVLIREECSPPSWAETWRKSADGRCIWRGQAGASTGLAGLLSHSVHMGAPDFRPNQRGPITLPIISLEE